MTLEQLMRALNVVADLKDEDFIKRAPKLYRHFADAHGGIRREAMKPQAVAEDDAAFIYQLLNYPEMAAEVMALAA
ncbi:MAG: hypothetical protein WBK28_02805 [Minisyncoccia bacterium]